MRWRKFGVHNIMQVIIQNFPASYRPLHRTFIMDRLINYFTSRPQSARIAIAIFAIPRLVAVIVADLKVIQFQRGARSRLNQLTIPAPRAKLRRACREQIVVQAPKSLTSTNAHYRTDDHRSRTKPVKPIMIADSPKGTKQPLMSSNVTRHFARTDGISSPESPYVVSHQAIRNYLNQTMPPPAQQQSRERSRLLCQNKNNLDRSCTSADTEMINNRLRSTTRNQANRLQSRHSFDSGCVIQRRSSTTTCDRSRFLDSHSQSHGVIAASMYKDLCNGTINW